MRLNLEQLSDQSEMPVRTIRYYIQRGLLSPPKGERRGAYYTKEHLAQLLRIGQWKEAGLSLDAIGDLLHIRREPTVAKLRAGSSEVRSHLILADGVELVVAPERAGLTQSQVRRLFVEIQAVYEQLIGDQHDNHDDGGRNDVEKK